MKKLNEKRVKFLLSMIDEEVTNCVCGYNDPFECFFEIVDFYGSNFDYDFRVNALRKTVETYNYTNHELINISIAYIHQLNISTTNFTYIDYLIKVVECMLK